jgi:hypothetical protein
MNSFSDIIPRVIINLGLQRKFAGEKVILHWRDIVGERIAEHTKPTRLGQGILTVVANNAVWAHHLMTSKEDIIANINNFCNEKVVTDIKFKAGNLKNDQNEESTEEVFSVPDWRKVTLTSDEADLINTAVDELSDDALRQKVRRIITRDLALKRAKDKSSWQRCQYCGILCPPQDTTCPTCSVVKKEQRIKELRGFLLQAPWLEYAEAVQYVDCHPLEFNTVRSELIDRLGRKIRQEKSDEMAINTLAMLIHHKKPQELTAEIIKNITVKVRGK